MKYTSELVALEDAMEALVEMICQSPAAVAYQTAFTEMQQSSAALAKKSIFQEASADFQKIAPYGKYAPNYQAAYKRALVAKRNFDLQSEVAKFRVAETELQMVLDTIAVEIASEISSGIKVDTGNPFFETNHGKCGGNCHAG